MKVSPFCQLAAGVQEHVIEGDRHVDQAEEVGDDLGEPRRTHRHDLRVAADD
jgi:hypothetical protein